MKKFILLSLASLIASFAYAAPKYVQVKEIADIANIDEKYIPSPDLEVVYKSFAKGETKARVKSKTKEQFQPRLQIYYPNNKKPETPLPCAIFFAGGGWRTAHPTQYCQTSRVLADLGMISIFAEYRTKSTMGEEDPIKCVEDAKSAVRYLREHAEELGIDPNMIAVGGASAGGHIAAATACLDHYNASTDNMEISAMPNLLLLFNPVMDNSEENNSYERVKHIFPAISPMHNMKEKMPPTIIFVGSEDVYCRRIICENYKVYLEKSGVDCELYVYEGEEHSFFNYYKGKKNYVDTLSKMAKFLQKHKYIK